MAKLIKSVCGSGLTLGITVDVKSVLLFVNFGKICKKCIFQFIKSTGSATYFCHQITMSLYLLMFIPCSKSAGLTRYDFTKAYTSSPF